MRLFVLSTSVLLLEEQPVHASAMAIPAQNVLDDLTVDYIG